MWRSDSVLTSAWAPTWPGWNSGSCSRSCCACCPASGWYPAVSLSSRPATSPAPCGSCGWSSLPPASSGGIGVGLGQVNVVVVERLAVDAVPRRGDPRGDLASLVDRLHQRADVCPVHVGGQPLALTLLPVVRAELLPVRAGLDRAERAHLPVEGHVRQPQPLRQPGVGQDLVPPVHPALAVGDVL